MMERIASLALFIIITIVTNGYILMTRLDRITELLEEITKPRYENKSLGLNVLFADGTTNEVKE